MPEISLPGGLFADKQPGCGSWRLSKHLVASNSMIANRAPIKKWRLSNIEQP